MPVAPLPISPHATRSEVHRTVGTNLLLHWNRHIMDVVDGKIVAAQNKGSEVWIGLKRSPDSVLEGSYLSFKCNQPPSSSRVKSESREWPGEDLGLHATTRIESEICGEDFRDDLGGVFKPICWPQLPKEISALSLALPNPTLGSTEESEALCSPSAKYKSSLVSRGFGHASVSDSSLDFRTASPFASGLSLGPSVVKPQGLSDSRGSLRSVRRSGIESTRLGCGTSSLTTRSMLDPETLSETSAGRAARRSRASQYGGGSSLPHVTAGQEAPIRVIGSSSLSSSSTGLSWSSRSSFPDSKPIEKPVVSTASYYSAGTSVFGKQPVCSWVVPLRFLLRKELTLTDVGELGRIILPKKDAEGQLPQLDTKEGKLLSMEDYNSNKHWNLRYNWQITRWRWVVVCRNRWWPNNKSRMYVLESTGEFVKFHDLKEKDVLILYQDGEGKLVIRGQKMSHSLEGRDLGCDTYGCGKISTGRRSPKGLSCRASTNESHSVPSPSLALRHSKYQSQQGACSTSEFECKNGLGESSSGVKSGPSLSLGTAVGSPCKNSVLSSSHNTQTTSLPPATELVKPAQLGANPLYCRMLPRAAVPILHVDPGGMGSLGPVMQANTGLDWEKLPDPPSIEFTGDLELDDIWRDCM